MEIQPQVGLDIYTTLQVGGPAKYFCEVRSVNDIQHARLFAQKNQLPVLVIGGGSNLLFRDLGYDGLVVKNCLTGRAHDVRDDSVLATFAAGETFDDVISETVKLGYWGLENLSHIPGTVGATPIQNVGAYGVEIEDLVTEVRAIHIETGELRAFTKDECEFSYRDSFFKSNKGKGWCIVSVTYRLSRVPRPILTYKDLVSLQEFGEAANQTHIRSRVIDIRSAKFPDWTTIGTAGSFFKNPIVATAYADKLQEKYPDLPVYPVSKTESKVSLGYLLDKICGLRGYMAGSVGLYEKQALVLINNGKSADEIEAFVSWVQAKVFEKTGITIEQEVRTV